MNDPAPAPRVRRLAEDGLHVGSVEPVATGFLAITSQGLQIGTFGTELEAVAAIHAHRRARRSAH